MHNVVILLTLSRILVSAVSVNTAQLPHHPITLHHAAITAHTSHFAITIMMMMT